MPSLFFPNINALRLVLASGRVPTALTRAPATAGFDPHGRLWLELPELPSREILAALSRFGVQALGKIAVPTERVNCWAELLPLRKSSNPVPVKVLLIGPDRQAAGLAARLRRETRKPLGIILPDEPSVRSAWIAIDFPRPRLLTEIAERDPAFDIFAEQSAGVWVQAGWEHQLPNELVMPSNSFLLLRPPRNFLVIPGVVPIPKSEDYRFSFVGKRRSKNADRKIVVPIPLHLALRHSIAPRESLWVVEAGQANEFWDVCSSVDERVLRRLEAGTQVSGVKSRVVIRCADNNRPPTFLPLLTTGFANDPRLPGLYIPANRVLKPHLRTREVTEIFGLHPDKLVWVESSSEGSLIAHTIPLAAFRPLSQLVVYTSSAAVQLGVEPRVELFPLARVALANEPIPTIELEEPIPITEAEIEPERAEAVPSEPGWFLRSLKKLMSRLNLDRDSESEQDELPAVAVTPDRRVEQTLSSADALRHGPDWPARRRSLENALFQELPRLGAENRAARWAALAAVYTKMGNPGDAAVCWMNAAWESATPPVPLLKQWLAAECQAARLTESQCVLERWLSERRPGIVRVVAAYTSLAGYIQPPMEFLATLPRILAFLEQHFDDLPIRAAWLARLAATRVCESDALGLARWRDRVLIRLADRGPGLDLDEPSFLRFHGSVSGERFQAARKWLESVKEKVHDWLKHHGKTGGRNQSDQPLQQCGLIAEMDATHAYADIMLAWGIGCLGERILANDWSAKARKSLSAISAPGVDSTVHAVLGDLFLHRLKDAQEGRPPKPGLPSELQKRIDALPELARYSVDRLREHSKILEPRDQVRAFQGRDLRELLGQDRLGERLNLLLNRTESEQLAEESTALLEVCSHSPTTDTLPRIVMTLLEVAPRLDRAIQLSVLNLLPTAIDWLESWLATGRWPIAERLEKLNRYRTRMIRTGFSTAASLDPSLVGSTIEQLIRQLRQLGAPLRESLLNVAAQIFQALRRLGLRSEADSLVSFLDPPRESSEPKVQHLQIARLGLSIGWFTAGNEDAGWHILNEARELLYLSRGFDIDERTRLSIAYAEALGFAPPGIAHGRLGDIFERLDPVKTTGSTNGWFTLKPLQLIDVVVRSVVTDEFSLGPAVRAWLDDDEFLIRGRIHRDLAALLREQGIW
jgi:hypothetical protein